MIDKTSHVTSDNGASVYRYYDKRDILIYVGITSRGIVRNIEHNSRAPWWSYVVRQEIEHCETRYAAERRERELIGRHWPPFNTQHNPYATQMRAAYLAWAGTHDNTRDANQDTDPREIMKAVNGRLPLIPVSFDSMMRRLILRTLPEHHPIAPRLRLSEHQPKVTNSGTTVNGRPVMEGSIEVLGLFAILTVRCRQEFIDLSPATARLKNLPGKPALFRIQGIELERG
jgi:hypothetical protein